MVAARLKILLAVVGVGASVPLTVTMLGEAWDRQQLIYHLGFLLADLPGLHIDLVVLIPAGILVGLLGVFALDEYKRVQRIILLLVGIPVFAITLVLLNRWTPGRIDWIAHWWGLLLGSGIGAVLGAINAQGIGGTQRRSFPTAARLLYGGIYVAIIVGVIERHLGYESPLRSRTTAEGIEVVTQAPRLTGITIDGWTVPYLLASVTLVTVVGIFVRYQHNKNITVLTPPGTDDDTAVSVLANLYTAVDRRVSDVTPQSNGQVLVDISVGRAVDTTDIQGSVGFDFVEESWRSRRRIVEYTPIGRLFDSDLTELATRASGHGQASSLTALRQQIQAVIADGMIPRWIRRRLATRSNRRIDVIDHAEMLLLVVSVEDLLQVRTTSTGGSSHQEFIRKEPQYVEQFKKLYELYQDSPTRTTLFLLTDFEVATEAFKAEKDQMPVPSVKHGDFREFLAYDVLFLDSVDDPLVIQDTIIPVDLTLPTEEEADSGTFDRLADRI